MRRRRSVPALLLACAVTAGAVSAHGSATARSLTLHEAIAMALERNESIVIQRQSLAIAEASLLAAEGSYDPVLGLGLSWQRDSQPVNSAFSGAPAGKASPTNESSGADASFAQLLPSGGELSLRSSAARETTDGSFGLLSPSYWTQVGVEVRQPLLRGRAIDGARLALRVATADRGAAAAALRREVTETVAAVERAYWTLAAARLAVGVREEAVRLAEEQLSETSARIDSGAAPETEIAQPRAELERRRGELLASREAAARAGNLLKRLILADDDADLWAVELEPTDAVETEITPIDEAAAMDDALATRAELELADATIDRRRSETEFSRDGIRPSLDLVASYDRFGLAGTANPAGGALPGLPAEVPPALAGRWGQSLDTLGNGSFDDARVALRLGIPIGNRAAHAAAAAALSAERTAEAERSRARKAIRVEVLDAIATLQTAGQRIDAARSARAAAEVQLGAERDRYAVGLSTNFLVLTRQNDLSRARLDEISALTDYRTAAAELGRATGSLLEKRGVAVDAAEAETGRGTPQ